MSMNVRLMYRNREFVPGIYAMYGKEILAADLETDRIVAAMSKRDTVIATVIETAMFSPLLSIEDIKYRQEAVADARNNADAIHSLYNTVTDTLTNQGKNFHAFSANISSEFRNALNFLSVYVSLLQAIRTFADRNIKRFSSEAFTNFFSMIQKEMDDKYFKLIKEKMSELADAADGEVMISATLGHFLQGVNYVFRKVDKDTRRSVRGIKGFTITEQVGFADLDNRKTRAYTEVANTLVKATKHMQTFFNGLRNELAFYVGCVNLDDEMKAIGLQTCVPVLTPQSSKKRTWKALYDVSLALTRRSKIVAGDYDGDGTSLYLITGANQGGKSTFLRSIGQAQLMAQAGMPIGAESCEMPLRTGLFTHFRREEDSRMKSGKLDEELQRLSKVLDFIKPGYTIMFNESFASTNEREGSEILRQITNAFLESGVEVFSVTHLLAYAGEYEGEEGVRYLKAERLPDGGRTFRIIPGMPDVTAFGEDLYRKIFESE